MVCSDWDAGYCTSTVCRPACPAACGRVSVIPKKRWSYLAAMASWGPASGWLCLTHQLCMGLRGLISGAGFEAATAAARCSWLRFPLVYWGWCILWVSRGWWLAARSVDSNRLQRLRLWRSWWTEFSVRAIMAAAAWHCSLWRSVTRQGIWFLWPTKQPARGGFALMANGERGSVTPHHRAVAYCRMNI
jgi:hypothetical protein